MRERESPLPTPDSPTSPGPTPNSKAPVLPTSRGSTPNSQAPVPPTSRSPGLFLVMVGGFALLPLSTDLYLASLPGLGRHFGVPASGAQATLSAFVVGFALAQLVHGPLSDRWGRRPALLSGLAIYFAASVACIVAPSLDILIAGRFFQGIGACAGTVIIRASVRDVYGSEGAVRMLGYIAAAVACFPLLGPILGGFVEGSLGWRWNLAILGAFAAMVLATAAAAFPETSAHRDPGATRLAPMLRNYGTLLGDRRFVGYIACLAGVYAGLFAFISGSAFVLIGVFGEPPGRFGVWFSSAVAGYLAGSLLTGRYARRFGTRAMLSFGTALVALAGTTMLGLAILGVNSPIAVVGPMIVYLFAGGITMPNSMAGALAHYPKIAGSASSLMGLVQMLLAAGVGALVGRQFDGTAVPMAAAVAVMSWLVLAAYRLVVCPAEAAKPPGG